MLKSQEKTCLADYQNILLKYVFTSRTYCCEFTSQMWQGESRVQNIETSFKIRTFKIRNINTGWDFITYIVKESNFNQRIFFLELINIISGIINTLTGERSLSAKTFFHIIAAAVTQVDLNPNRCFKFFTNFFTDIRYMYCTVRHGVYLNNIEPRSAPTILRPRCWQVWNNIDILLHWVSPHGPSKKLPRWDSYVPPLT